MGPFMVGIAVVIALAILVALAFTKKQYAGVGCILAICIMSCGFLAGLVRLFFH